MLFGVCPSSSREMVTGVDLEQPGVADRDCRNVSPIETIMQYVSAMRNLNKSAIASLLHYRTFFATPRAADHRQALSECEHRNRTGKAFRTIVEIEWSAVFVVNNSRCPVECYLFPTMIEMS
jgi:hypothetical protein